MGDFGARIDVLAEQVGGSFCVGKVIVDQIYALYQHEDLSLRHTHGGQAKYLYTPLFLNRWAYLQQVADTCLNDGGKRGMAIAVEHLAGGVSHSASVVRGDVGGALGALTKLPSAGGFPTVGEAGSAGAWGVAHYAPDEFGELRGSGHPIVYAPSGTIAGDGVPVYDRAPAVGRMSEAALRIEGRSIRYSPELIEWLWRHFIWRHLGRGR